MLKWGNGLLRDPRCMSILFLLAGLAESNNGFQGREKGWLCASLAGDCEITGFSLLLSLGKRTVRKIKEAPRKRQYVPGMGGRSPATKPLDGLPISEAMG